MSQPLDLRHRMRTATDQLHHHLDHDALSLRLMSPEAELRDYGQFLARAVGFMRPLEQLLSSDRPAAMVRHLSPDWLPRTPMIESDLRRLGVTEEQVEALPVMPRVPVAESPGHIMGILYVIEGSAMGGLVLAKQVGRHLDLGVEKLGYFLPDEPKAIVRRFERFVATLNSFAQCACDERDAIEGAVETFQLIGEWFKSEQSVSLTVT